MSRHPGGSRLLLALLPALLVLATPPSPARSQPLAAGPAAPAPPAEALAVAAPLGPCASGAGAWVSLSALPWAAASTGWPAVADVVLPERGVAFSRNPLVVAGRTYDDGLGTYPLSEVEYDLRAAYSGLRATVGLNDDAPPAAAADFLVFADGVLVYNSGPVRQGEPGRPVELCLAGVRRLRLVSARAGQADPLGDDLQPERLRSYADWAEPQLFRPDVPDASAAGAVRELLGRAAAGRRAGVVADLGARRALAAADRLPVAGALDLPATGEWPAAARAGRDGAGRLVLANRRLALLLGFGGPGHGGLTVLRPEDGRALPVWQEAGSAVVTAAGTLDLRRDTEPAAPDAFRLGRVDDPVLGPGAELRATFRVRAAPDARVEVRLVLLDDRPQFTYQLVLTGWPAPALGVPTRLDYRGAAGPALVLGDGAGYAADASYVRQGELPDDGLWRSARLGIGKPAVLWGEAVPGVPGGAGPGIVALTLLDEPAAAPARPGSRRTVSHAGSRGSSRSVSTRLPGPAPPGAPGTASPHTTAGLPIPRRALRQRPSSGSSPWRT